MFDFERFLVYQKAKTFSFAIKKNVLTIESLERISKDQLRRASLSVALNIAEGASRFSRADKRNFYVIARASAIECVAILDILKLEETITNELYQELYLKAEEISRMLYSLIRQLEKKVWVWKSLGLSLSLEKCEFGSLGVEVLKVTSHSNFHTQTIQPRTGIKKVWVWKFGCGSFKLTPHSNS